MAFEIKYIYELVDKISPKVDKIKRNVQNSAASVKSSARKMSDAFERATAKVGEFGRKASKIGKDLFLKTTVPIGLLGISFTKAAADAQETANKFNEIFSGIGDEGTKLSKRLSEDLDLANSTTQELLSKTGDLLTGIGLSSKEALNLSGDVVKLSADLASFKNTDGGAERAALAITKALLGENEMLKDAIGTQLGAEEVKKRAIQIAKVQINLTEKQAKAMATLQIIAERNKAAIGDLARTKESLTNKTRKLRQDYKSLSVQLGTILIPYALKLVNALIKVVKSFSNLSPRVQKVTLVIAALAAILPPLLISIGLISVGISAISAPVAAAVAGFTALIFSVKQLFSFFSSWNKAMEKTTWFLSNIKTLASEVGRSVKSFFGVDVEGEERLKSLQDHVKLLEKMKSKEYPLLPSNNGQSIVGQNQSLIASGEMNINLNGFPKGSTANMTQAPNSFLNFNTGFNKVVGAQ